MRVEDFYLESHRAIFRAMEATWKEAQAIDGVLLLKSLRDSGEVEIVGGGAYISRLATTHPTAINWIHYHGQLEDCRRRRDLATVGRALQGVEDSADPFEAAEAAIGVLAGISGEAPSQRLPTFRTVGSSFRGWAEDNRERYKRIGRSPQWSLGWKEIDDVVPLYPGKSLILGGRSGSGKTGLAAQALITTAVERGEGGMLISLEMNAEVAYLRSISRRINISEEELIRGDVSDDDLGLVDAFISRAGNLPLVIDDDCPRDVAAIDRRIRAAAKQGIRWIAIDYLQLMRWPGRRFDRLSLEYGEIVYRLHRTAQRTGVGLCILAQLRKEDSGKIPNQDSLKDGGDALQAVDACSILWRPFAGDLSEEAAIAQSTSEDPILDDMMRIATVKHRYGSPCSGRFGWDDGRVIPMGYSWPSWSRELDRRRTMTDRDS